MKSCLINRKSIALLLALVFTISCILASCERPVNTQPPMTDEELRAMPIYTCYDGYDLPMYPCWRKPVRYTDKSDSQETVDYYGETYDCTFAFADHLPYDGIYCPDSKIGLMRLRKYDDKLNRDVPVSWVHYDYETSEPLSVQYFSRYLHYETFQYPEDALYPLNNHDAEAIRELLEDYTEEVLNDKYNKGIDLDNYEFSVDSFTGVVKFKYYINGVVVHEISFAIKHNSSFVEQWECIPVPPVDVLQQIPNITTEQYKALVSDKIIEKYVKEGETVKAFSIQDNIYMELFYTSALKAYLINIRGRFSFERENGEIVSEEFGFAIPLIQN